MNGLTRHLERIDDLIDRVQRGERIDTRKENLVDALELVRSGAEFAQEIVRLENDANDQLLGRQPA